MLGPADRSWPTGEPDKPSSPGMLARHYAPATRLRLDAREVRDGEALLAFGARRARSMRAHDQPQRLGRSRRGRRQSVRRPARARCRSGATAIAVMPIPEAGPGRGHQRPPEARREAGHEQHTPNRRRSHARSRSIACAPSSGPSTRSPIPTSSCPTCASGATCTRAAPSSCCGPARPRRCRKILALAHEHGIPVVPQAGNTGLVGGQMPMHGEIAALGRPPEARARASMPRATP